METSSAVASRDSNSSPVPSPSEVVETGIRDKEIYSLILKAAENEKLSAEKFEKLMDMQLRIEGEQANKALFAAIAKFQGDCPTVLKNKKGNRGMYAEFEQMVSTIRPVLQRHGLSYLFSVDESEESCKLVTRISHTGGGSVESISYFEKVERLAGTQSNSQQRRAALTYAKRTGLELALGLVAGDESEVGTEEAPREASEDQFRLLDKLLIETRTDTKNVCKHFGVSGAAELNREMVDKAILMLRTKRNNIQRKKQMGDNTPM